jgi:hypothetical protein
MLLAHYTKAATAFEKIIPNDTICLWPLADMRDPHESTEWRMWTRTLHPQGKQELERKAWEDLAPIQRFIKVLSLTTDAEDEGPFTESRRCYSHSRLWDQYGDRYRGVCLLFDQDELRAVVYQETPGAIWREEKEVTYGPPVHLHPGLHGQIFYGPPRCGRTCAATR